ncbi:hypothetical protein MD484_g9117, partial [Candolleomyces efflorescens]
MRCIIEQCIAPTYTLSELLSFTVTLIHAFPVADTTPYPAICTWCHSGWYHQFQR